MWHLNHIAFSIIFRFRSMSRRTEIHWSLSFLRTLQNENMLTLPLLDDADEENSSNDTNNNNGSSNHTY